MREYVLVLLVAAGFTYLLAGLCRRLAFRFNAVALVRDRDVHTRPIPYFGGVALLCGLGAAFLVAGQLPWLGRFDLVAHDSQAVLIGGAVICAVGVLDDMFDLNALAKIAGQMLAAGIVVLNGVKVYWIPLPGTILTLDDGMSIVLTVALIFICVNSINLIDGLDGLAAGVVAIGAGTFFAYAYWLSAEQGLERATTGSLITVTIVGICLGFLPYNVHPARMFMGDSGSMLLGFLLATAMISLTGQIDPSQIVVEGSGLAINAYLPLLLPLAVMALPLGDLILAYIRRTLNGGLWFQADKQHLHHRMLQLGHSHRRAVALLWLWSGLLAIGAVVIGFTGQLWAIVVLVFGVGLAALLTWHPAWRRKVTGG